MAPLKIKELTIAHTALLVMVLVSGLIINVAQLILYVGLRPFSKHIFRKINYYCSYSFCSFFVFLIQRWANCELNLYIDKNAYKKYGKEHALLIANHNYEIDWMVAYMCGDHMSVLGNIRAFSKKTIQYIPILGWMWKFNEFIFLERSFEKDKHIITNALKDMGDTPDPVWLMMNPEGTRFSPKKHEESLKFAREKGLPILNHHLNPRSKGFSACIQAMEIDKFPAVYNIQLAFDKNGEAEPTMTNLFMGKRMRGHLYIDRIPLEDIPKGDNESAQWLINLFETKDRLQTSFHKTGDFFEESGVKRLDHIIVSKRFFPLLNTIAWATVVLLPITYWLIELLFNGELFIFIILIGVLGTFYLMLQFLIGQSQISNGSEYGLQKKK